MNHQKSKLQMKQPFEKGARDFQREMKYILCKFIPFQHIPLIKMCGHIQYRIRFLIVRPRKLSKAWDRFFIMFVSLWKLAGACQMSEQLKNSNYWFHPFQILRNIMMKHLMWHWLANICIYIHLLQIYLGLTSINFNPTPCNVLDEMTYTFPNFNSCMHICVSELCPYCFR